METVWFPIVLKRRLGPNLMGLASGKGQRSIISHELNITLFQKDARVKYYDCFVI